VSITCDFLMTGSSGSIAYSASKTILVVPDPPLALGLPITWTGESNAIDCIQAKDHSTGRTEIASCLRVAEVGCWYSNYIYFYCK
jgi:hypothetical protein